MYCIVLYYKRTGEKIYLEGIYPEKESAYEYIEDHICGRCHTADIEEIPFSTVWTGKTFGYVPSKLKELSEISEEILNEERRKVLKKAGKK